MNSNFESADYRTITNRPRSFIANTNPPLVEMLTDAHMGEGGVKNCSNHAHVVYGRSLLRKTGCYEFSYPFLTAEALHRGSCRDL